MVEIAIILVHLGDSDAKSVELLQTISKSGVKGITKINASHEDTQEWLKNNTKGVVVNSYPSFMVAEKGRSTQVYSAGEVYDIIDMARKLTQ